MRQRQFLSNRQTSNIEGCDDRRVAVEYKPTLRSVSSDAVLITLVLLLGCWLINRCQAVKEGIDGITCWVRESGDTMTGVRVLGQ